MWTRVWGRSVLLLFLFRGFPSLDGCPSPDRPPGWLATRVNYNADTWDDFEMCHTVARGLDPWKVVPDSTWDAWVRAPRAVLLSHFRRARHSSLLRSTFMCSYLCFVLVSQFTSSRLLKQLRNVFRYPEFPEIIEFYSAILSLNSVTEFYFWQCCGISLSNFIVAFCWWILFWILSLNPAIGFHCWSGYKRAPRRAILIVST